MSKSREEPISAYTVPPRQKPSNYPEPFATQMKDRVKRPLGDLFGITSFGVNFTELQPGATSALLHKHSKQEEFVLILSGHPTLYREGSSTRLSPGDCVGFTHDTSAHKLVNETQNVATYLEIGNRDPEDSVSYPEDDLVAEKVSNGNWVWAHKDGRPYK